MYSYFLLAWAVALVSFTKAQTTTWLSRPEATTITLKILKNKKHSAQAPGYLFVTPWGAPRQQNKWGPHIFDQEGHLVWAGNDTVKIRAMDTHVCSYEGRLNVICFNDADPVDQAGHSAGLIRFLDSTYTQIGEDHAGLNGLRGPDIHELNTPNNTEATPGDRFIQDIYELHSQNLTQWTGPENGLVLNGCFQDVQIPTNHVNFQWCSLDHIPVWHTIEWLASSKNHSRGDYGNRATPWDYFHINAIDRDVKGNYYVSARNTCAVYKIAGPDHEKPGSVIWILGGSYNSFEMLNGLNFSFQHHVRVEEVKGSYVRLSLFDNATPEVEETASASTGKVIELNTDKMTAKTVQEYVHPGGLISHTEGSVQRLPNGNIFVGWGSEQYISEHTEGHPGEAIFYAKIGPGRPVIQSYRSYKYEWKGEPKTPPDVFAYSKSGADNAVLAVYMSWNGATEHRYWRIFVADSSSDEGIQIGDTFPRTGYETMATLIPGSFKSHVYVQALDGEGNLLKTSRHHKVFVPKSDLAINCGTTRCPPGTVYASSSAISLSELVTQEL